MTYHSSDVGDPYSILTAAGFEGASFSYSDYSLKSMRGPCPKCGGSRRLLIFVDNPLPFWNHRCDLCGLVGKRINVDDDMVGVQIKREFEEPNYEENLDALNQSTQWIDYHTGMTEENRQYLRDRGVPDDYQDKWVLGYTPRKAFVYKEQVYHSAAYTIPKINHDMKLVNVDYRLLVTPDGAGKYRYEFGLKPAVFISEPGNTDLERLFIVEGSFKAMVLHIFLEEHDWTSQVIGLPAVSSLLYRQHVDEYLQAYVMLDPDSPHNTKAIARETGATPIYMPAKIDDAIIDGLTWPAFQAVIANSGL